MNKVHTLSIDDFKENPIVERIIASSTEPVFKRLFITVNVLTNVILYTVEYKNAQIQHPTLSSAIETYNTK